MGEQVCERMLCDGKITGEDVLRKTAQGMTEMLARFLPFNEVRWPSTSDSAVRRSPMRWI